MHASHAILDAFGRIDAVVTESVGRAIVVIIL